MALGPAGEALFLNDVTYLRSSCEQPVAGLNAIKRMQEERR